MNLQKASGTKMLSTEQKYYEKSSDSYMFESSKGEWCEDVSKEQEYYEKKKAKIHKGSNHYSVGGTKTLPTQHDYDENMLKFVQVLTFKRGVVQTH